MVGNTTFLYKEKIWMGGILVFYKEQAMVDRKADYLAKPVQLNSDILGK